jgi:hypothetical protein
MFRSSAALDALSGSNMKTFCSYGRITLMAIAPKFSTTLLDARDGRPYPHRFMALEFRKARAPVVEQIPGFPPVQAETNNEGPRFSTFLMDQPASLKCSRKVTCISVQICFLWNSERSSSPAWYHIVTGENSMPLQSSQVHVDFGTDSDTIRAIGEASHCLGAPA